MSTRSTLICAILGTKAVLTVTLDDTQTVADLKKETKATNENTVASFDAHRLTLYKVKLRVSEPETFRGHISGFDLRRGARLSVLQVIGDL